MASQLLWDRSWEQKFLDLVDDQPGTATPYSKVNVLEVDLPNKSSQFAGPRAYSEDILRVERYSTSAVRIIFAPLDYPTSQTAGLLQAIFDLFDIPPSYLHERVQGVTQSLNFEGEAAAFTCWLHFLCKAIVSRPDAPTWHRSGYFLEHNTTGTTLVCFGASKALVTRFQQLPAAGWASIHADPLALLAIVLADLQLVIDEQVWALNDSVGSYEHHAISTTRTKTAFADDYFQDLHWVAKNVIHLKESADAALNTCDRLLKIVQQHENSPLPTTLGSRSTVESLQYLGTLFNGTSLRTSSLNSRIQNTIALSFNLVAQTDSHSLRAESSSMHTIALTTLVFLPISTVATIFGSQFFSFNPPETEVPAGGPEAADFVLSKDFWLFWAITVPLTVIVVSLWLGFHPDAIKRWWRRNISPRGRRRTDAEVGSLGGRHSSSGAADSMVLQQLAGGRTGRQTTSSTGTTLINSSSLK